VFDRDSSFLNNLFSSSDLKDRWKINGTTNDLTLNLLVGKYFKSSRKTDSKTKGSHKSSSVQRSFKSDEEKRLFRKDENLRCRIAQVPLYYNYFISPTHSAEGTKYQIKCNFICDCPNSDS
jgi:hypothetical protein